MPKNRGSKCFAEKLACRYEEQKLKTIYILDYEIKPRHPSRLCSGPSAVEVPVRIPKHNGKFRGHGVTFYAIATVESFHEWFIPLEAINFQASVSSHLNGIYGYNVAHPFCIASGTPDISVEFLACIRD